MDETYIKVKGVWKYLYRAVDKQGKTIDFLLTAKRDMAAAKGFFDKVMGANGDPDKVAMDKSGAPTRQPSKRSTPAATSRFWCARLTARMRCRSPTNFTRWQEWSFQYKRRCDVPGKLRCLITNATEPQDYVLVLAISGFRLVSVARNRGGIRRLKSERDPVIETKGKRFEL